MKATWWVWQTRKGRDTAVHFFTEELANEHARFMASQNDSPAIVAKSVRTVIQKINTIEHDQ